MKLAVAIQNHKVESNDFLNLSNFEIILCISNNRIESKIYWKIVLKMSPFLKSPFPPHPPPKVKLTFILVFCLSSSLEGEKFPRASLY